MSRLDFLSQTTSRLVDVQSRNAGMNPDPQESKGNAATSDFGSFLEGISGKVQKQGIAASQCGIDLPSTEASDANPETDAADDDPLLALLPETPASDNSAGVPVLQSGSPALSILENLLPRILARSNNGVGADAGQSGASLASSHLSMAQQAMDDLSPANSGLGSKLAVSVQNQETHFRPIVEGISGAPSEASMIPTEEIGLASENLPAVKLNGAEVKGRQSDHDNGLVQDLAGVNVEAEAARAADDEGVARSASSDRVSNRTEMQKQSPILGSNAEGASLPPSTLHQLAKSIVEDARGVSDSQQPNFQHDGLNRVATARASAGVLRVLDLQLKPAELGLVTIRMRLAGDSIEMEIHTQSEDTAELLRHDAEKLSSLLRASGYRPDVISIQSTENASHDRSSFQRPQQGDQAQSQSFEQGAAAGNGSPSRHRDDRYAKGGSDVQQSGKESSASSGSHTGGIYL
jgi:chemotaxis protein MotD